LAEYQSARPAHLLPLDTDHTDGDFEATGFAFGKVASNRLYRLTYLPARWRRTGNRIVDDLGRERVCVTEWTSLGTTYAHMHLTDLIVYLRRCVALGEPPIIDRKWASRKTVLGAAVAEVERVNGRIAELTRKGPMNQIPTEHAHLSGFEALAVSLSPLVEVA
jgi:hypothetical protein